MQQSTVGGQIQVEVVTGLHFTENLDVYKDQLQLLSIDKFIGVTIFCILGVRLLLA